jgi:hypothetical protein
MTTRSTMLKWLLLIGALYFLAVSAAHMMRIKVPLLFVYYNVPSYDYQDRIISFLSFGWSLFLFIAARDPEENRTLVKAILVAGIAAIFGLHMINADIDFHALSPSANPSIFRWETFGLSVYVGALIFSYFLSTRHGAHED